MPPPELPQVPGREIAGAVDAVARDALIVATVEQDGLARSSTFVARYRAPGVVRPGRPGRVRVRRGRRAVFVWAARPARARTT
jgi:hypothetical protein